MLSKNVLKWLWLSGGAVVIAFTAILILTPDYSTIDSVQTLQVLPIRISIPSININADIEPMGLAPDGTMNAPKGPAEAGWFDSGPRPGEIGSAVIDGHSGWKDNIPAVFDNLYTLKTGNKIYVEDATGATTTFVVREIRTYDPKADASRVFGSSDGKAHLNLITCAGVWNESQKSSSERLVVFTDYLP